MKTDKEIHELFVSDPAELFRLLGKTYPDGCAEVRVEQFKQVEQTADLIALPSAPTEPGIVFEFQAQKDVSIDARLMIATDLFCAEYPSRRWRRTSCFFPKHKIRSRKGNVRARISDLGFIFWTNGSGNWRKWNRIVLWCRCFFRCWNATNRNW